MSLGTCARLPQEDTDTIAIDVSLPVFHNLAPGSLSHVDSCPASLADAISPAQRLAIALRARLDSAPAAACANVRGLEPPGF